jgi:nicotinamidase-related amidase
MKTALLIVDVQKALVDEHPYDEKAFLERLGRLIGAARENGVDVVYVRHDEGKGTPLHDGEPGFEIHAAGRRPKRADQLFEKKYGGVQETELQKYQTPRGIARIECWRHADGVLHRRTCRAAFELGTAS